MKVVQGPDEVAGGDRVGPAGGEGVLRSRRDLHRALPHLAPPRRDADRRRPARQRGLGRQPRLLGAAPPPEADRGGPGAATSREGVDEAMGEAAVKVAKAVGYYNAGTVEFLYQDGEFFFLEMNTRLQVEHPVTEMVTGIDLVELADPRGQRREAAVHPGATSQRRGHAIEIRINAEDPAGGRFLPSPGPITKLVAARRLRRPLRRRLRERRQISQYYDNLVGKLIVWGKDRPDGHRADDPRPRGDAGRGRGHDHPGRPRHPAPPRLPGDEALHEVGRGTPRPVAASPRPSRPPGRRRRATAQAPLVERIDDGRGQRQALRREDVGAGDAGRRRRRRRRRRPGRRRAPPRRAVPRGAGSGSVDGADAGHDRQGARRGRPGRSRSVRPSSCSRR